METENNISYKGLDVVNVRLVKESSIISEEPVTSQVEATSLIRELLSEFDREVFGVLNLATDGTPINLNIVSIGTLNSALVSPREVFKGSILSNAAGFIAYHCHPSGNPRPSREDAVTTERLKKCGELLDIKLIDHIIVGCRTMRSFSFKTHDLLDGKSVEKEFDKWKREQDYER